MGGTYDIRRVRRRLIVAAALLVGLLASEPALAQLPPGSSPTSPAPTGGSAVGTVTQVVPAGQVAEQAAPIVGEAAKPVAAVTEHVAEETAPAREVAAPVTAPVAQAAAPVTQAAAPVVAQVATPVTNAAEPVLEQTARVLESVQPLADAAAPVADPAQPVVEPVTTPLAEVVTPVIETTMPLLDSTSSALRTSAPAQHIAAPEPSAAGTGTATSTEGVVPEPAPGGRSAIPELLTRPPADTRTAAARERIAGPDQPLRDSRWAAGDRGPSNTWRATFTAPGHGRTTHTAKASASRAPSPTEPSGPIGFLAAVSATFASSGALILFAAVAAFIIVAAPGLGRRFRPAMAPWPQPTPLPSLERPG